MGVRSKRVYDPVSPSDGRRYLVERLWPRGISKDRLQLTEWLKEVAPSPELREWFGHDPSKFPTFRTRYLTELEDKSELLRRLNKEARKGTVTLLFAARDREHCSAEILREVIDRQLRSGRGARPPEATDPMRSLKRVAGPRRFHGGRVQVRRGTLRPARIGLGTFELDS